MQSVIVYYRTRPTDELWSELALIEQRAAVAAWLRDNPATVLTEEIEIETDGFARPSLQTAITACKISSATLLIARTEAIGSGALFEPRIVSVKWAIAPATPRLTGHRILVPPQAPVGQLSLYFPLPRAMHENPVYLCNASGHNLSHACLAKHSEPSISFHAAKSITPFSQSESVSKAHLEIGELRHGAGVLIDTYHPMIDSDFTLLYQVRFTDAFARAGLSRAIIGTSGPDGRFVLMRG